MRLFPAVDMLKGRCVRLLKGDYNQVTDYGTPLECAKKWVDAGAEYLHLVDLDGALTGKQENLAFIERIKSTLGVYVQTGGGIRAMADIDARIHAGADKIILGTILVTNFQLATDAALKYGGNRFIAGVDAKDGKVAVSGWTKQSQLTVSELLLRCKDIGITTAVFTDISRDGALSGVNDGDTARLQQSTGMQVIASGGVKDEQDLKKLQAAGVYGAILGKSLYSGTLNLERALKNYGG